MSVYSPLTLITDCLYGTILYSTCFHLIPDRPLLAGWFIYLEEKKLQQFQHNIIILFLKLPHWTNLVFPILVLFYFNNVQTNNLLQISYSRGPRILLPMC